MAERIEVDLDLSQAVDSAKQLGAALQTTKTDTTAFGAALAALDGDTVKLVAETTALQRALEQLAPPEIQATKATSDFSAALEKLAKEEAEADAEAKRLAADAADIVSGFGSAARASKTLEDSYRSLSTAGHGYEIVENQVDEAMDRAVAAAVERTRAQKVLNQILDESTTKTSTASVSLGKVSTATKETGYGVLHTAQAFQDFTSVLSNGGGFARALGSVQNNIPQLLAGLGAGAGLAGTLSLASVAIGILVDNFGKLYAAWSGGQTEKEIEQMEKLAKAADSAREAIQKQIDALEKQRGITPGAADIAKAAIDEQGGAVATSQAVQKQMLNESPEARVARLAVSEGANQIAEMERKARNGGIGDAGALDAARAKLDSDKKALEAAENDVRAKAQGVVVGASQGDRTAIADLARRFPGGSFGQATPEGMKAADAEVDAVEAEGPAAKAAREGRRDAAKKTRDDFAKNNKLIDDLNEEGKANEKPVRKQMDEEFQQEQAVNAARAGQRTQGPTFRQAAAGLERKQAMFAEDAQSEQSRGVQNGPATQAYRAATAQLQQLMKQYADATQQLQVEVADLQGVVGPLSAQLNTVKSNNRNLQTRNNLLKRGN